jgi:Na+/H+ antiporter NhaB
MSLGALLPVEYRIKILIVLAFGVITLFFMIFVDAATIQLVAAKKRIGWRKILGDKLASSARLDTTRRNEYKEGK